MFLVAFVARREGVYPLAQRVDVQINDMPCKLLVLLSPWLAFFFFSYASAADPSHLVTGLPGQPGVVLGFQQYAGYITVNQTAGRHLFYWFYEADHNNHSSLPLVLWLNGGPGCSSVGAGALSELGPFRTNDAGTGLLVNTFGWNQAANVIFLESPIGVGFSYSNTSADYSVFGDEETAHDSLGFLLGWLNKFPEYSNNDLYLIGESYAGHYVPQLAAKILQYNKGAHPSINLKGFAVGNGLTDVEFDGRGQIDFLHSHSLISDETYHDILKYCYEASNKEQECNKAEFAERINVLNIDEYNIYGPSCNNVNHSNVSSHKRFTYSRVFPAASESEDPCLDSVTPYLNLKEVKKALHADENITWSFCSKRVNTNYRQKDIEQSLLPLYRELLKSGIRIWIYSGDVDSVLPTTGTRYWIKALNLTIEVPWYAWKYQDQVGGWTQDYAGLTFTTVRGSGHMVPKDKPGPSLEMFKHFLRGERLPNF